MSEKAAYNPWIDLVLAMLSTGGYRLEKTYKHRSMLIENGLTDPRKIRLMDEKQLAIKLVESGYNRGPVLTAIYTERLVSLGKFANAVRHRV